MDSATPTNKQVAINFLELVTSGNIDEAYDRHVDMNGKHHNVYFPAGMKTLREAMKENQRKFPQKKFAVKHALAEGAMVVTHSHVSLEPGTPDMVVVHIFRLEKGKIVELWDVGQPIALDQPNADGAF